jgi:hypothetical protein
MEPFGRAWVGKSRVYIELDALSSAQAAAGKYGFYDLDVKDNDLGHYTIVAYGHDKVSVRVTGKTMEETVEKLLKRFSDGN